MNRWSGFVRPAICRAISTISKQPPSCCTLGVGIIDGMPYAELSDGGSYRRTSAALVFAAAASAALLYCDSQRSGHSRCEEATIDDEKKFHPNFGQPVKGLRTYKASEVAEHNKEGLSVWVTFKEGVYDITGFVKEHPGGKEKILMAAGGAVDDFWRLYRQHLQLPEISHMLEAMRIGNLDPEDFARASSQSQKSDDDPFRFEPDHRHPALQFRSQQPCNAEAPLELLVDSFETPNELFFVRNHFPVPPPPEEPVVRFEGVGLKEPVELTVDELREKFPQRTVSAVIQCAGNRRSEFNRRLEGKPPVKGLNWTLGAISSATWTGPRLSEVLQYVYGDERIPEELASEGHVQFWGRDGDGQQNYGASVPAAKALSQNGDVILALEMNGEPLPVDHGWPVRVVAPGLAGARNVKWLSRVCLEREESPSFWQKSDYKFLQEHNEDGAEDADALQVMPVTSAICHPVEGATVSLDEQNEFVCKGYAYSGGGRRVKAVDVSVDGGRNWSPAMMEENPEGRGDFGRAWSWVLWSAVVSIPPGGPESSLIDVGPPEETQEVEIIVRAIDDANNTQPERPADSGVAHVVDSAARLLAPEALRVLVRDSIHHASYDGPAEDYLPLEGVGRLLRAASYSAGGRESSGGNSSVARSQDPRGPPAGDPSGLARRASSEESLLLRKEDIHFYLGWLELGRANRLGDGLIDKGRWLQEL
ncbi:hypothetical protein FOL46_000743 [Perkinsus olseni]|uniref:sulfite oxidase n=1 Tax=Perkinsus olseni TaxID=32597 RepID=A0A7J6MGH4_PEROL|nr:hypothetical protein FOL46_000743 [Perkinsus olseni]